MEKITLEELDTISDVLLYRIEEMENYDFVEEGEEEHDRYQELSELFAKIQNILLDPATQQ